MKLIDIIRKVNFYKLDLLGIFYLQNGCLYFNKTLIEKVNPNIEDSNIMDMSFYEKGLSIHFNNGANWLIFSTKDKVKIPYSCLNSNIAQHKIPVYEYDFDLLIPLNNIYNVKLNLLVFPEWYKGSCHVINSNIYLYIYQKEMSWINLNNNNFWHFSIADFPSYINGFCREQEADIKQIIGVYNNLLWVHVGGFCLIGIAIETGKLVHQIEDIPSALGLTREEGYYFSFNYLHLNEQEGVLKAFANRYYIEIDLNTLQGVVKKDFGENEKKSWRIRKSTYYPNCPDLLFFSGHYQNISKPNAFGIFDTEKAEIVWYDTTKDDLGYFYNPPQANNKLLAVLDDRHNLLIYERDAMK